MLKVAIFPRVVGCNFWCSPLKSLAHRGATNNFITSYSQHIYFSVLIIQTSKRGYGGTGGGGGVGMGVGVL